MEKYNYKGLNIIIENPVGSIREGKDSKGNAWRTKFFYPYGYIDGTVGADGGEIDCFIGEHPEADSVYIMHQLKSDGRYDEDKVFLGFLNLQSARDAYLAHYSTQGYIGKMTAMPFYEFKNNIYKREKK